MPASRERRTRIRLADRDETLILQRFQVETTLFMESTTRMLAEHHRYVMHPESGLWVMHRHLDRTVKALDSQLAGLLRADLPLRMADAEKRLASFDAKLLAAETAKEEQRRWWRRDMMGQGVMLLIVGVLSAVGGALLVLWLGGRQG